jgi:mannitol/fructose-specific phosphotransferase system IIA component (Ntr-type)
VLARISRLLRDPRVRQDLLAADSAQKVLGIIRQAEGKM